MRFSYKSHRGKTAAAAPRPWWKRIGWMVVIWAASVMALAIVASIFRLLMLAAGMKTH
ncbi:MULTISPECIES: DUF2474 domain-containing protein [Klebsiella/Raoultella group]|uniref:DUF2474 domain-containing protein n=1 Tax=Klebsiella/Raoultella group TaxID=2890311 RepID=UPI00093684D1|nr:MULTISPECIES: DUF2474 domain-containing protein [Klebsiella/Raoultella group]MBX9336207.1 DUF2474 domain-containing protein [Serratia marcescens]MCC7851083.1 DUF2474 domain-containing protein [Klebsiella pneumoniae]MCE9858554.1 DUF2474 domain-containing protein [Raoultella planticola]RNN90130.1 DUF2474 domain-containing protein [Raoultella planticola]TDV10597.1 uncharacterized protein DUF2474 [Raoultella planticola]